MDTNEGTSALSSWCRPVRRRACAVGLSAAALVLAAACSSGGTSGGGSSASTPLDPRQALLAAATQARQVTSAAETLTVQDSTSGSTTTGTVQIRLKPALLASENLNVTAAGTSTQVKAIVTGTAIYLHEASLAGQLGKPWVKMDLSALSAAGTIGASVVQLIHSVQGNSFTNQAQLFTVATNTRAAGTHTVDGVTTTEYTGSFTAAAALKALPASLRQALAPELQALGNSPVSFREWVDSQHHLRKMTETETVNGDTVNITINVTAINQPVHITPPPASQTFTLQGSGPVSGNSGSGGLSAKVVPAPPGFAPSQAAAMNAADFNQAVGEGGNPAASLHFVRGYGVTYDSTSNSDRVVVFVFQFAAPADAAAFKASSLSVAPGTPEADPLIPGAEYYDATSPSQGMYDHGVIGSKGNFVFVIDDATASAAPVPLVETMARQQYAAL
jgi:hypothetical protein